MKIGIIGSGNVGITTAFAIAEKGSGHVVLWGPEPGQAKGKALDLAEAAPIRRYDVRIEGTDAFEQLLDSNVLVVTEGARRTAGMGRFDLFEANLPLVRDLGARLAAGFAGREAPVTVVMTGPVDVMTLALQRATGWPRERVVGIGGNLSASRLRHFVSRELGVSAADIDAMVLGTHDETAMVILERYCRVSGLPLSHFLTREQIGGTFAATRSAGTAVVEQAKVGSSFYTPGAAAGEVVAAIAMDSNRVLIVSTVLDGEYGVAGRAMSVPAKIGCSGVKHVYELALDAAEAAAVRASAAAQDAYVARVTSA
jgi:malate dehydrogenase